MNGAFLHLVTNHIPVIGLPFGALLLGYGLARKSRDVVRAAYLSLIAVALLTIVALKTGKPAARIAHNIPGVTRESIHEHAEAGEAAFWAAEIVGVASLAGLFVESPALAPLTLVGSIAASAWFGWVAHLGGLIRHPEVAFGYQAPAPPPAAPAAAQAIPNRKL